MFLDEIHTVLWNQVIVNREDLLHQWLDQQKKMMSKANGKADPGSPPGYASKIIC